MVGPNATSRKNEMTSGTFGFVSLAQQLPSKPKTQGWLRIYIWTDCKWRLTFAFVEINHDSSRLQARQGRRKVWKSEGYNLSSLPDWHVDNVSAQIWVRGSIDRPSAPPVPSLVPTVLKGHMRSSWTEKPASLAWHHAQSHSQWCGDVHHDRIARYQCQVKNVTQALTSINKINQLLV